MSSVPISFEDRLAAALRLAQSAHPREAIAALRPLLDEAPEHALLRRALVRSHLRAADPDAALEVSRHPSVLDVVPALADVLSDFAAAHALQQHTDLLRARAERHPDDYQAALALASALHGLGRPSEALPWCERAHALRPLARRPLEIRATALIDRGDVEQGLALYRELLARADDAETSARYLVLMHYDPAQDNRTLFDTLRTFAERHLPTFATPFASSRDDDPRRALRIGWLSPRFNAGPVASFLPGLLAAFDRMRHRHLLIALQPTRDEATIRLQALADEWFDFSGLDDLALLHRLRALELDVVIDLAGHSTANRIAVVAQRVAPLQVSWLDWFDTTAVPAMDAWISDAWLTPTDSTQRYTERVVRLPSGRFCYTPPDDAPSAVHAGGDAIVFASFNRLAKLNADVVAAWSAILQRTPGSRLHLGARLLDEPATRARTLERFAARGIDADRLVLNGQRPYAELLAAYRSVDIALDPFPFSGCTTTCDALFMGCAVVALPGETFVGRQSASLLWRLGKDEWVARDQDDYIERAVAVAAEVRALRIQRAALREAVRARLCDAASQASAFAAALHRLRAAHSDPATG
jgi:predicted O-linked N-acetylglucosamine transferase (SPINDLY family)